MSEQEKFDKLSSDNEDLSPAIGKAWYTGNFLDHFRESSNNYAP